MATLDAAGVEPLRPTEEMPNAAMNSVAVPARIRLGVSHVWWRACNHDRVPLAPAIAAMTQPAHMAQRLLGLGQAPASSDTSPPGVSARPTCTRGMVSGAAVLSVVPPAVE